MGTQVGQPAGELEGRVGERLGALGERAKALGVLAPIQRIKARHLPEYPTF